MSAAGRTTVALALAAAAVGAALLALPAGADGSVAGGLLQENGADLPADRVVVRVRVKPDGTARWQVDYRMRLDGANRTAAFEAVRENVTAQPLRYAGRFRERQQPAVAAAANGTGRKMALRNVSVAALRQQPPGLTGEYGVLRYTFEWAGFGATDGARVRAGDALTGFFLRENWVLLVTWPADYRAVETVPAPDEDRDRTAVWRGPTEFAAGGPRVVVEPTGGTGLGLPGTPVLLAAVALALLLLAAGWHRRETLPLPGSSAPAGEAPEPADRDAGSEEPATAPTDELLSDEERVVRLLAEHGGRMKQQDVVAALDWSETKTSQVVGELHEAGTIERYRLGRENVLALPGEMDV
jgi:uncharacterized membrane protein